jgi:geranylgeranyl reductase family protein
LHFDCDVLVVGAGPAGTVAARQLAAAGARVRIVDRATFPRDKLCGDTLNPGCLAMLDRLDATVATHVRTRGLAITGMTITGPGGATVHADYPSGLSGAALLRRELDQWLLEAAVRAGARFDPGIAVQRPEVAEGPFRVTGVRSTCGRREYALRARVIVAADGRSSRLAASLGLSRFARTPRRWAYGTYFTGVSDMSLHGEMHIRPDGYVGVAPLARGIANVCVVRERPNLTAGQPAATVIANAIAADRGLRDRFGAARAVSGVTVLGPLAVESAAAGCPGMLLAGDAAGFVDPMTGDGLRFAIRGGQLAAQAALRELETGEPAYQRLLASRTREFAGKWRVNRALRSLVGSRGALICAAAAARAWPTPVQRLVALAGDVNLARGSA